MIELSGIEAELFMAELATLEYSEDAKRFYARGIELAKSVVFHQQ